jgi:hypothetical protein
VLVEAKKHHGSDFVLLRAIEKRLKFMAGMKSREGTLSPMKGITKAVS